MKSMSALWGWRPMLKINITSEKDWWSMKRASYQHRAVNNMRDRMLVGLPTGRLKVVLQRSPWLLAKL